MKNKCYFFLVFVVIILIVFCVVSVPLNFFKENKKIEYSLDLHYNQEISSAESNVEILNINQEYAKLWNEKINIYYKELIEKYSSNGQEETELIIIFEQTKWEKELPNKIEQKKEFLLETYESGSIIPVELSEYEYMEYRYRALNLFNQCLELNIDVEFP